MTNNYMFNVASTYCRHETLFLDYAKFIREREID